MAVHRHATIQEPAARRTCNVPGHAGDRILGTHRVLTPPAETWAGPVSVAGVRTAVTVQVSDGQLWKAECRPQLKHGCELPGLALNPSGHRLSRTREAVRMVASRLGSSATGGTAALSSAAWTAATTNPDPATRPRDRVDLFGEPLRPTHGHELRHDPSVYTAVSPFVYTTRPCQRPIDTRDR
jgi:hypothetical protein